MEKEVKTTEEEKNRKATMEDVEAFAKEFGVSKTGCTYNKFTIALVTMINVLYNHTLASSSINLECLKILVGEPMYVMEELMKVKKQYEKDKKDWDMRYERERKSRVQVENTLSKQHREISGFLRNDVINNVIVAGIRKDLDDCVRGNNENFEFMMSLKHSAYESQNTFQKFFENSKI
tara:strand:+ start:126 stop:659 length:534 start_codon:yes stop_codon:yes gene_type:complete